MLEENADKYYSRLRNYCCCSPVKKQGLEELSKHGPLNKASAISAGGLSNDILFDDVKRYSIEKRIVREVTYAFIMIMHLFEVILRVCLGEAA